MNDGLSQDYKQRLGELADALYEGDPYVMGSLVGAPQDEYSSLAARLLPALSGVKTRDDCAQILEEYDIREEALVDQIWRIVST
jgi:hypothetical protein